MFGASDSADRRRAGWRGTLDALRSMTRLLPGRPAAPTTTPVQGTETPPESRPPHGSEHELHEQHHVHPLEHDEHRHG